MLEQMVENYVKQPENSNLCGQACVAIIAGITLKESIFIFGKGGCTSTKDVIKALRKLGFSCGDELIRIKKKEKSPLCIVVLHFKGERHTHWTVFCEGAFFDPAMGIGDTYPDEVYETSYLPIYGKEEGEREAGRNNITKPVPIEAQRYHT